MTNPIVTLSRERLEQLADENTICKVSWDERIEMARALLAVMDAKPYGYVAESPCTSGYGGMMHQFSTELLDAQHDANEHEGFVIELYSTPPAPSVPDELSAAVNLLLDVDGSRGTFSAIRRSDALAEVERLLAAGPVPGE